MNRDIDCSVRDNPDPGGGGPVSRSVTAHRCSNYGGTSDDSWTGELAAGAHSVRVYPYGGGTGNYTITVSGDGGGGFIGGDARPPLSVPAIPDFRAPSGGSVDRVFPAATGGTAPYVYSASGLPPGITFAASTRRASGTLPTVTTDTDYTVTYTATDSASPSFSVMFITTVTAPVRPSAPQLTGAVAGRTQTLTWTEPATGSGITRYQLQTRASTAHAWRFTGAGSPSPSSNISPSVRSWSMVTPWTLVRQYQVRATNAVGDGAWSNVVELTTGPPPPPPSLPGIPDFRVPSGGTVSTVLPAATGGTAPYVYSLSDLPPGLTFYPSTRRASGTLQTVTTDTTYTMTYTATDSAGASVSVTFTATVIPPPPPPPPPPPSLPGIPDFRVPSGGTVSTLFPAATGGTAPYVYSLSGLPPGLTFSPSTRIASGTLPTVATETTYAITYAVADSAGLSDSVTFTATVVP